jgi:hypothetical protein
VSQKSFIDDLLVSRRFLLITGKGGIGKTLLSCCLAKRAQLLGRRVLIVEQSVVEQVGPLLGFAGVGHEETWAGSLGVANFTPGGNFRDFITKHLMKSSLLDVIFSNKILHSFFTSIPGFSELMLLGRIYYALNESPRQRPDLVIMDSYASGHFMSLMTTPNAVIQSGLAGPILHLTTKVRDWLADVNECGTIYVGVPEELVVSETLEFLPKLIRTSPVALSAVAMNRCLPVVKVTDLASPASVFYAEKLERQAVALKRFYDGIGSDPLLSGVSVVLVPELGYVPEPLSDAAVYALCGGNP